MSKRVYEHVHYLVVTSYVHVRVWADVATLRGTEAIEQRIALGEKVTSLLIKYPGVIYNHLPEVAETLALFAFCNAVEVTRAYPHEEKSSILIYPRWP